MLQMYHLNVTNVTNDEKLNKLYHLNVANVTNVSPSVENVSPSVENVSPSLNVSPKS
jgi:hypothetical protein